MRRIIKAIRAMGPVREIPESCEKCKKYPGIIVTAGTWKFCQCAAGRRAFQEALLEVRRSELDKPA